MSELRNTPFEKMEIEYAVDASTGAVVAVLKVYYWDGLKAADIIEDLDGVLDYLKDYVFD